MRAGMVDRSSDCQGVGQFGQLARLPVVFGLEDLAVHDSTVSPWPYTAV